MRRCFFAIAWIATVSLVSVSALAQVTIPPSALRSRTPVTPVLAQPGPGAVVVPRDNCGTHWTEWSNDPEADSNPCPPACERGERQVLNTRKAGDQDQYQARYQCYLPELVVNQPAGAQLAAAARQSCGTAWTSAQNDLQTNANPCPANCERGELQLVRRSLAGDGQARYEMRYQCYVAQPEDKATSQSALTAAATNRVALTAPTTTAASPTTATPPSLASAAAEKVLQGGIALRGSASSQRAFALTGFAASGTGVASPSHAFPLAGFTAAGDSSAVLPHVFALAGFTAVGRGAIEAPHTFALTGFAAGGTAPSATTHRFVLSGWTSTGSSPGP